MGTVNFYGKFMENLSNTLSLLYKLLQKKVPWHWSKEQNVAFIAAKQALSSNALLVHHDPGKELLLTCAASPDGVDVVLSHLDESGERPITFANRSLDQAEKNYSQLDREGQGIIFSVKKFHKFLFGRKFTIVTDLLLLWRILNGRGLPNCLTELPSLKCLSSSLHSQDSHPFANVLRPSPSGSPSASPTLTCALQE